MKDFKKKWIKPKLIWLIREEKGNHILSVCKTYPDNTSPASGHGYCFRLHNIGEEPVYWNVHCLVCQEIAGS